MWRLVFLAILTIGMSAHASLLNLSGRSTKNLVFAQLNAATGQRFNENFTSLVQSHSQSDLLSFFF